MLEKTLESPLDCKKIQPVHPKGNQSWIFIGKTDAEAETPILWPPDAKNWLIWKDPDAGKGWRWEEKGTTGWDSWMASATGWTWVWVNSESWWWTGRPGMLQSMGLQIVGHNWTTELNWSESIKELLCFHFSLWKSLPEFTSVGDPNHSQLAVCSDKFLKYLLCLSLSFNICLELLTYYSY